MEPAAAACAGLSRAPTISSPLRRQILKLPLAASFSVRFVDFHPDRYRTTWRWASSGTPSRPAVSEAPSPGLYTAKVYELTKENVDLVLNDVRPYLISDGGDVDVVSVEDGVITLQLRGACGSCPSSTTTMKMGIERVLKEKFGEAVRDIRQAEEIKIETTVQAVNNHLEILRPAIRNYGGSVEVVSVDGEVCSVRYTGPESIGSGVKAAIKEKFPDIVNVVFVS